MRERTLTNQRSYLPLFHLSHVSWPNRSWKWKKLVVPCNVFVRKELIFRISDCGVLIESRLFNVCRRRNGSVALSTIYLWWYQRFIYEISAENWKKSKFSEITKVNKWNTTMLCFEINPNNNRFKDKRNLIIGFVVKTRRSSLSCNSMKVHFTSWFLTRSLRNEATNFACFEFIFLRRMWITNEL